MGVESVEQLFGILINGEITVDVVDWVVNSMSQSPLTICYLKKTFFSLEPVD